MKNDMTPSDNVLYFPNNIDVRLCPKNGMSTLKEALRRNIDADGTYGKDYRGRLVSRHGDQFDLPFRKGSYRIAVWRDPIARFKSACEFIKAKRDFYVERGKYLPEIEDTFSQVIEQLDNGVVRNNHFYTQSWYMGVPEDYDIVYHINDLPVLLEFLEKECKSNRLLSDLHENKTHLSLYDDYISPEHMEKLRNFYLKDFKNGWCKEEDRITF